MTETTESKPSAEAQNQQGLPLTVHAQYLRDLSFENPNAPMSLRPDGAAPEMDIKVGIDARKMPDVDGITGLHEVVISLRAEAKRQSKDGDEDEAKAKAKAKAKALMFIAELQYGVTVSIDAGAVPEDQVHPLMFIEVPRMAFPFARQIIADVTVRGGYPPLLLQPVDFYALYMERFGKDGQEKEAKA